MLFLGCILLIMGFPRGSVVKNTSAEDSASILGSGRSPGRGNGNPLQYFCLENPMDRGAWWATVHGVAIVENTAWRLNKSPLHQSPLKAQCVGSSRWVDPKLSNPAPSIRGLHVDLWKWTELKTSTCYREQESHTRDEIQGPFHVLTSTCLRQSVLFTSCHTCVFCFNWEKTESRFGLNTG